MDPTVCPTNTTIYYYYYCTLLLLLVLLYYNELSTQNRFRSQRTPTPYKIKVNNCKLIDLVIRIELPRAILMPRFSNYLRNSIIHFCMFLYLETCFLRVTASLLCRLHAVLKTHVPIYPYRISERRRNCSTL